jgi:hypothetical protein
VTGGVIQLWQENVDEGVPVREVSNIDSATEDTSEAEDEKVQELAGEDFELDTNTLQDSNKRFHPIRGSFCWLKI